MNTQLIREFLKGRKTYLAVAIGALYVAGTWAGCWEMDEKVLASVGLGGLAFLRAAVETPKGNTGKPRKNKKKLTNKNKNQATSNQP